VEKWANEKGVEVRVILFPLPIHPQAFGKSVALVCDKKGWEEYKSGYNSNNQCEDGKKKIESNLSACGKIWHKWDAHLYRYERQNSCGRAHRTGFG
jgi:thiol:disulfide interchange protein DsbC